MNIPGDLLVFSRDHVGAPADAFAANLRAVAADEPENLIVTLAAERAASVAHCSPQSSSGADAPRLLSADCIALTVLVGNCPRYFHVGTSEGLLPRPANLTTSSGPPSSAMTSSTVLRCLIMPFDLSRAVIIVKDHKSELDGSQNVYKIGAMSGAKRPPFAEDGRRFRLLRQAEGFKSASAFAQKLNWPQSGVSQFETGQRRVPADKALQLRKMIPGFDPLWLWEGDKKGLSFDLRRRIEEEEAKEEPEEASVSAGRER